MPFIKTIDDCRLHYTVRNEKEKNSIILLHGNSNDLDIWLPVLDSPELSAYRLIAIDLPGHGDSGPLDDRSYTVINMGNVIADAVTQLSNGFDFILVGLSLGTNVLAETLSFGMMPAGIGLFSPTLTGRNALPSDNIIESAAAIVLYTAESPPELVEDYLAETTFSKQDHLINLIYRGYLKSHPLMRAGLKESILRREYSDEIQLILNIRKPVLCIFGEQDRISHTNILDNTPIPWWGNSIFKLAEAGHQVVLDRPEKCIALLEQFAGHCFMAASPAGSKTIQVV